MTKKQRVRPATEYDTPWKTIVDAFLEEYVAFFHPHIHAQIDWTRGYEPLDKEFQRIARQAKTGRGYVDKLFKVWNLAGEEEWLLIHLEVQGQPEIVFPERMYIYNYRIYDYYRRRVISLALLIDDDPNWRPDSFGYQQWGCEVHFRYPMVKLLDYKERWDELEASKNPFAVVVMAHLKTMETKRSSNRRLDAKIEIIRNMYKRGYKREYILGLFHFIDWLMALPEKLEITFEKELKEIEGENKMRYVTGIERRATEKGIERGIEKGEERASRKAILEILSARFQTVEADSVAKLDQITSVDVLMKLLRFAATLNTLEDFERLLDENLPPQVEEPVTKKPSAKRSTTKKSAVKKQIVQAAT